ncbi:MAG: SRPBCC family protein [Actinomycetota bacterium]|nr:SRPBCC family protein [Actinomycetota bacterium]
MEEGSIVGIRESATATIKSAPADVFRTVTDLKRLPEWNKGIVEVVELPDQLQEGSLWKVRVRAMGQSWVSKSTLTELDPESSRFAYRSQSDDGNPSFADWAWHIEPDGAGSRVTVTVDLNPLTFWRKNLLIKIRRTSLRKEMHESLAALQSAVAS